MDLKELGANLGLEAFEFTELVELFLTTAKKDLQQLREAYRSGDSKAVAGFAHSLKGSSGNLGFSELSMISRRAEDKGGEDDLSDLDEILDSIHHQIRKIESCLMKSAGC